MGRLKKQISNTEASAADLRSKISALPQDTTPTNDQCTILTHYYQQKLADVTQQRDRAIAQQGALPQADKDVITKALNKKYDPSLAKWQGLIGSLRPGTPKVLISEEQKSIIKADYQKQLHLTETNLETLNKQLDGLTAQIAGDNNELNNYDTHYAHPKIDQNIHQNWEERKQSRWDKMNSKQFGYYVVWDPSWFYNDSGSDEWGLWDTGREIGSFSVDGQTCIDGPGSFYLGENKFAAFGGDYNPKNDSPQMQQELVALLHEAEYDRDNYNKAPWSVSSTEAWVQSYGKDVDYQITVLQQRIDNEKQ